jgi:uncharacterized protein (DUF58 family)
MLSQEILAKIRQIELRTRRLLNGMQAGDYITALKGSGLEFDQIREYQVGDDVRFIDWNSSVRMNKMLVRQYLEERNRTVLLLVDTAPSTKFGSTETLKSELIANVASVLALVADYSKDAVGLIQYSNTMEKYIAPARGRKHAHKIMEHLFEYASTMPDEEQFFLPHLDSVAELLSRKHKNALVFVLSDFIDNASSIELFGRCGRHADMVAIRCLDPVERTFPEVGILAINNLYEQKTQVFDMSKKSNVYYNNVLQNRLMEQNKIFKKYKMDIVDLSPNTAFIEDLITFSKRRTIY